MRFRLACQPCKYYLLLVNGYPHLSFRAALILFEVANWKRGISVSEPLSFQTLASETYENYPCEKLRLAKGSKKEIPHLLFSSSPLTCAVRDDNMLRTCLFFIIAFYSPVNLYRTTRLSRGFRYTKRRRNINFPSFLLFVVDIFICY